MSDLRNTPDYLNARDALAFYRGGNTQSQVIGTCFFDSPADDSASVHAMMRDRIEARVPHIPRLVQHVVATPMKLAPPAWFSAENIDLDYHVRSKRVPGGKITELMRAVEDVVDSLDMTRPPWRVYVVEGFDDGKWALVLQAHHVLGDGAACIALFGAAFADMDFVAPQVDRTMVFAPPARELVRQAFRWQVNGVAQKYRDTIAMLRSPNLVTTTASKLTRLAKLVWREIRHPYKPAAINRPASGEWVFRTTSRPLGELKALAESTPRATVNTVFLSAAAHALKEALAAEDQPLQAPLKIGIPKSLRRDTDDVAVNSCTLTSNLVIAAPLEAQAPLDLLGAITDRLRNALDSEEAELRSMLGKGGAAQNWPMKWNVTATMLHGPPDGLYSVGSHLEQVMFSALPGGTKALGLIGSAYNGNLSITVVADRSLAAFADRVCAGMQEWMDDLAHQVAA